MQEPGGAKIAAQRYIVQTYFLVMPVKFAGEDQDAGGIKKSPTRELMEDLVFTSRLKLLEGIRF
tara:strand:+ start:899 stop:1090 length:192 start_codon:yes stop_codon:yes gene_type:complete